MASVHILVHPEYPSMSARHLTPEDLCAELRKQGIEVHLRRADLSDAPPEGIVVFVSGAPVDVLAEVSSELRSRLIFVGICRGEDPQICLDDQGLLGLVDWSAWMRWEARALASQALYGRDEIARRAGLVRRDGALDIPDGLANLPEVLARYLQAESP